MNKEAKGVLLVLLVTVGGTAAPANAQARTESPQRLEVLVRALEDPERNVRQDALERLGRLGADAVSAAPAIVALLQREAENYDTGDGGDVILAGALTLAAMGRGAVPVLVAALPSERDDNADIWAGPITTALSAIGEPALRPLIAIVGSDKEPADRRAYAASAIGRVSPKAVRAVPALRRALASDDQDLLVAAAGALGKIGGASSAAVPELLAMIRRSDSFLGAQAVYALGQIGSKAGAAAKPIGQLLSASDPNLRNQSAWALAEMGAAARPALAPLLATLNRWTGQEDSRDPGLWSNVARALGNIGPAAGEAFDVLANAAGRADEAAMAIAKIDPDRAVPILLSALEGLQHDTITGLPLQLIRALGECGSKARAAVPLLERIEAAGTPTQSDLAREALLRIRP